jgi:uncharacterized membrane protein YkoI
MSHSGLVHRRLHYNRSIMLTRLATAALLALLSQAAWSGQGDARPTPTETGAAYADGLTLDQAVAKVEAQFNARAVKAEEKQKGGRRVYRIRLLSADGRVFDVTVDAATGKVE